jgi:hypothetical protein
MVASMLVGMAVLGGLVRLAFAALGWSSILEQVDIRGPIMATNMTIGMAVWMRHRGHQWSAVGEMACAMYVPLVMVLVPFWLGAITEEAVLGPMHLLMLPAMAVAMLHRRDEYTDHPHNAIGRIAART